MNCPRCTGLMVHVDLYDNTASITDRWYSTEQCVNCSYIYHPLTDRKEVTNGQETTPNTYADEKGKEKLLRKIMSHAFPLLT